MQITQNARFFCAVNETPTDLAAKQNTWQISVNEWGESNLAVDGILTTRFHAMSCIHTDYAPAIWSVDLGAVADIFYVEVLNRAESLI